MKKPASICIFGDSTSWGAWDIEKGGWVNRLWSYTGKRDEDYTEIYNLSISGGTTETILYRFENEALIRKADALIFQTGGNDSSYQKKTGSPLVSLEQFSKNLEEIFIRAKKMTDNIIFVDLKNCNESKTMPVWWDEDLCFSNIMMGQYNEVAHDICKKHGVFSLKLENLSDNEFDEQDGLHPNAKGHEKIFEQIKYFLEKNNWI